MRCEHCFTFLTSDIIVAEVRHTEALLREEHNRLQALQGDVQKLHEEMETMRRNEQQTVSLLVSEKVSLTSNLERLEGLEAGS